MAPLEYEVNISYGITVLRNNNNPIVKTIIEEITS